VAKCWWSVHRGRHLLWFMSGHFKWRYGNGLCLSKIHSMTADTETEGKPPVYGFWIVWICGNQWRFLKKYHNRWWNMLYGYDPKTKQQASHCKFPSLLQWRKAHHMHIQTKLMLYKGVIQNKYALQGQVTNQNFCLQVLEHLFEAVHCNW